MNLISVEQLADMNCFVGFDDSSCFVQDRRTRVIIGTGHRQRGSIGLYVLNRLSLPLSSISGTAPAHIPLSSVVGPSTTLALKFCVYRNWTENTSMNQDREA